MTTGPAEAITGPICFHGEGPVWSERWGGLRWVDMMAGDVMSLGADGQVGRRPVGTVAAALRPRRAGGAVIAVERGFALEDPDGTVSVLPELWAEPDIRMNDGGCDPEGRFYCGTMANDERPGAGSLFRLDPDGGVQRVLRDVTISNGLDWSPDGARAYYNDTPTNRVSVFDYDPEGGLSAMRTFVEIDPMDGHPDGLTVDTEGGIWVALYAGGAVRRYTPEGALDAVIEVPASRPTACALAPSGELFITTSREGLALDEEPAAGSLFRAEVGVGGRTAREFAG
jgi:sugar lactone lactonase YvrE